jgi:hypothetical protein
LFGKPIGNFGLGYNFGVILLRNGCRIGKVIAVGVRKQDIISFNTFQVYVAGQRIARNKGIEQEAGFAGFDQKAGVAVIGLIP